MLPTKYFAEYKWSLVEAICEKGVGAVVLEEPECFVFGSYSEGFREAWQEYYNEPWKDMTLSAEAQYKTCKLMTHMWEEYVSLIGKRTKENYPNIELWVAAHSTISYNTFPIVSCLNAFTASPMSTGISARPGAARLTPPFFTAGSRHAGCLKSLFWNTPLIPTRCPARITIL